MKGTEMQKLILKKKNLENSSTTEYSLDVFRQNE